jgi:hypothetical protein
LLFYDKRKRLLKDHTIMNKAKPYAELVTQAEEATKAIKDPELRRVAFERVLDDLLSGASAATPRETRPAQRGGCPPRATGKPKAGHGPKAYVRELIDDGFFKKPKTIAEVRAELGNRGHHIAITSLSGPLQKLCQERALRRQRAASDDNGKRAAFNYSEW